jgi:hypothetical protein
MSMITETQIEGFVLESCAWNFWKCRHEPVGRAITRGKMKVATLEAKKASIIIL